MSATIKPSKVIDLQDLAFALWNKYADNDAGKSAKGVVQYLDEKHEQMHGKGDGEQKETTP